MSDNNDDTKWSTLNSCPKIGYIHIPSGVDKNNYIAIDSNAGCSKINCIHKYDIDSDKWSKIDGLNNLNMARFSAALNVKDQILFLSRNNYLTQIQLKNNNINHYNHNIEIPKLIPYPSTSKSIIRKNALFIVGGCDNNLMLKWDSQNKTFTKFVDMYNRMDCGLFGTIYNNKNNKLLLFGGYDFTNRVCMDTILEFNTKTKQWNKLQVSLPKQIDSMCCTIAINNKYVLLFGGEDNNFVYYDHIYVYSLKYK
eukprot:101656_1